MTVEQRINETESQIESLESMDRVFEAEQLKNELEDLLNEQIRKLSA